MIMIEKDVIGVVKGSITIQNRTTDNVYLSNGNHYKAKIFTQYRKVTVEVLRDLKSTISIANNKINSLVKRIDGLEKTIRGRELEITSNSAYTQQNKLTSLREAQKEILEMCEEEVTINPF